ncbi:MAG: D-alanyl-D-alanine carboxypeptidase/D-alanyl-D-alanine-endopeptidase [Candidatus Eremiobacteraeota bacterium]|nr:D-alanyl-D-alanine carboxypeptidase/D-alanyl-D-alanine-endopeptidase [Candidatus Eremiobacteraeota bacterium]
MKRPNSILILLALFILLPSPAHAQKSLWDLSRTIERLVKESQCCQSASVGVFVKVLKSGEIVYAKNADIPLVPSSNLKVLTSAAAFACLGPDYRYKTTLYGGPIDPSRGIIETSLYLVGSGDPTFGMPFTETPTAVLEDFAQRLFALGLRRVEGDLVGDDSVFDREFIGKGWKTRYILDDYAAECGGLSLNANLMEVLVQPGKVTLFPECPAIEIVNKTSTGGYTEVEVKRESGTNRVLITGTVGYGAPGGATITVHNPPLFTTAAFGKILKDHGIYVSGKVKLIEPKPVKYSYRGFLPLCSHESPKLFEIVKQLNKESDNFLAQQVFRTLGAEVKGKGTLKNSEDVIRDLMDKAGVDKEGLKMADGSGLSNFNRVTTRQLVGVLDYMYFHPHGKKFIATLPQAGVDGTMKYRLSGSKVFAKTGTINENSSLSGYVWTAYGQVVVFSIISNNHKLSQGFYKDLEDRIVGTIAKWPGEI